jgi:hypothetical protein
LVGWWLIELLAATATTTTGVGELEGRLRLGTVRTGATIRRDLWNARVGDGDGGLGLGLVVEVAGECAGEQEGWDRGSR